MGTTTAGAGGELDFERFAVRIRRSSNFRVAWQLIEWSVPCEASPRTARQVLETIVLVPELQTFLASAEPTGTQPPTVQPLHAHSVFKAAAGSFERTVARAAADHLGAYSQMAGATPEELREVEKLFESLGPYVPFELLSGEVEGCPECRRHNEHMFSDWFYGVAWDWCFCVIWEERGLVGVLCMTDTD